MLTKKSSRSNFSLLFLSLVQIAAIPLAILYPSVPGFLVLVGLYLFTGVGVTVGYHRRLCHHSFEANKGVDYLLALVGMLSGEGPPIFWVAFHRKHHQYSDLPQDPHSPRDGFWWAHWLWLFQKCDRQQLGTLYLKYASDLLGDRFYQFLEKTYILWHIGSILFFFLLGYVWGGIYLGVSLVTYGVVLRMLMVLHATWMVNSICHCWGYRNYDTPDRSYNNWMVAWLNGGEGWHNNHHHASAAVNHGQYPWEFDFSYWVIVFLAAVSQWLGQIRPEWQFVRRLKCYSYKTQSYHYRFPKSGSCKREDKQESFNY